ncbi:conserved exported hypothetical protein [Rubrivivax sp. A210]|uniref:zinc-dependent metalloprotease n=1 Tax=Rubrivivax sp. A210 TaxID=2772301 RepID=UPI00191B5767|nr:zinc-dependent metalloprotease [Rubrivivax sp. A210]CAD5375273.1 conserved exported hypothetical protein [Rubrivivax sp. A210]
MNATLSRSALATAAALAVLGLAGCVTPPAGSTGAAAPVAAASAASAPAAARPDPAAPKPFAEVIKDAKRQDGFLPLWRKDEKLWLEIAPERLAKPFLVSVNVATSVGERGLYASQMGPSWLAEFRRIGNQMQLVARNVAFRGERDPASRRAVGEAFSESLLAGVAVASAAHPERKSVLVDASFLLGDLAGYTTQLEAAFRMPFAVDRANSYFEATRAEAGLTTLAARVHYAVPRIAAPPLQTPGSPPPPRTPPPQATPDPRSLFVGHVYNFRALPEQAMPGRRADPRVGHFIDSYTDLSDDLQPNNRVHLVNRWRLEKKDAQAALSEPVQPITYWMDRNVPQRYRASVEAGILEWNKAFERIGFKNAIVARQQPDDADFDTLDAGHASVRWFVGADVGFAIGPSHSDPRTGEILDADIGMSEVFGRGARRLIREDLMPAEAVRPWQAALQALGTAARGEACHFAADAAQEMGFAFDLLAARGDLDPESPEAEAFVQGYVKAVVTHEVGHTLGLRHNFKASTVVTREQLKDRAFGQTRGLAGSVMDYNAFNLPLAGEPSGAPTMDTLGPYDYWAIEYAYRPLDAATETRELAAIAARSASDPLLAFADDADAGGFGSDGLDPLVNRFDLGDDPLAFYQRRMALTQELWQRVQARGAQPGDDPERLRRSLLSGFRQFRDLPALAAKYVGGMHTSRDAQGSGGRPAFRPVEPARQRDALRFLADAILSVDSFRFRPEFLSALSPDYVEYGASRTPPGIPQAVLQLQTQALDRLLAAGTAQRLLDLPNYVAADQRRDLISLSEVHATLQSAVWSELKSGREIEPLRRSLQREHLKRLQAVLTRPSPALPADAVSLARLHAVELQSQLRAAVARKGLAVENRAHLEDALALLTEALRATLQRG